MVASELRIWNPTLYEAQITPLVYLSGVLLFVAGLSIVRSHSIWVVGWQSCVTLAGWFGIILGLIRMFFPQAYRTNFKNDLTTLLIEAILILVGIFLTIKAYWPQQGAK
ncbi:hypothetical protein [Spirosoma gilvum]